MARHQVVLIPGDGIGPEVTARGPPHPRRGGRAASSGWSAARASPRSSAAQDVLPRETLDAIRAHRSR